MSDPNQSHLYHEARAAFHAAHVMATSKPAPGSHAWDKWESLVMDAIAANAAYHEKLENRPHLVVADLGE
jgi:hypothetical protein